MQCCIVLSKKDAEKIKELAKSDGKKSIQKYMSERALDVLNTEFKPKTDEDKTIPFQFRLEPNIHKLIKEKATSLNRDMSELFKEVIFKSN